MIYNFTDAVRSALTRAREEAVRLGHDYVGPEHMLLGLLADDAVEGVLRRMGLTPWQVRSAVESRVSRGSAQPSHGKLPYTSRAKKTLEFSMAEARAFRDPDIRTMHLLLGLLWDGKNLAADVLARLGVTKERVLAPESAPPERPATPFRMRIDEVSDRSIYEQIVARVTEAVATGELQPGERMPTVRQLADELDIAPGTVARAYGELERQGVVVTEGARGTRVAERSAPHSATIDRPETLAGLLRPVAVAAFHLGASAAELRAALEEAMRGIFDKRESAA